MGNAFVVADTHFGHKNIVKFEGAARPFDTIEEHDEALIKNWNAVVGPKDTVWHLGDVAFPRSGLDCMRRLNGTKRLILGNHDTHPILDYAEHFSGIYGSYVHRKLNAIFTHIPIALGSMKRWNFNVHGHTHWDVVGLMEYINVCVEHTDWTPLSFDELRERM